MRLLLAESDPALAAFLQRSFDTEHYAVEVTKEGDEAESLIQDQEFDLTILDLNVARPDGLEVLKHIRAARSQLPILVLSNRNRPEDRVQALDMGADDLVMKPFSFSELSARVRALLRRGGRSPEGYLRIDDLELNRVEHSVKRAGQLIELTPKEFSLLEYLMRNAGQNVTRAQIIEHVWNLSFDTGHTDDVPIHNRKFDSNWELSTARATEIAKLFITKFGMDPLRLSASGYGQYHPTSPNDSIEDRAKNRRVDLVILNANVPASPTTVELTTPPDGANPETEKNVRH
jgi:DNA-binding response OmpR family regulator